jgi:spectinomycin phosphotransferase
MRTRPDDIDDRQLDQALRDGWGIQAEALEYVAIGGGTHHWQATDPRGERHWLSLDDLDDKPFLGTTRPAILDRLRAALEIARTLYDRGLDFIVAPRRTRAGEVLVPITDRYALSLYPFLRGTTYAWGEPLPASEREQLLDMLVRLHASTPQVATLSHTVSVGFARRANLEAALQAMRTPWCSGPLGESARALLLGRVEDVAWMLTAYDQLAADVADRRAPLVLSHGEPHPSNVMAIGGQLKLLDWDTVGLAPPERDLWWLATDTDLFVKRYKAQTGRFVDPQALKLYRLRWQIDDLIWCISALRAPHTDTVDTRLALSALPRCVEVPEWMR